MAHVDFTGGGPMGKGFAQDMVKIVALGMRDRGVVRQEDPSGNGWPKNAPDYAKEKDYRPVSIGPDRPKKGTKGGDMMSEVNLTGNVTIEPERVAMEYGTTPEAKLKAQWFTNGSEPGLGEGECSGAKRQPPRPFYGLDDAIERALDERVDRAIDEFLRSL